MCYEGWKKIASSRQPWFKGGSWCGLIGGGNHFLYAMWIFGISEEEYYVKPCVFICQFLHSIFKNEWKTIMDNIIDECYISSNSCHGGLLLWHGWLKHKALS